MIKTRSSGQTRTLQKEIDRHRNMLVIGQGATNHAMNQVMYYESPELVEKLYGTSELSEAFRTARSMGVQHVFIINVRRKTDYIEVADALRHNDFTYIVPLGVNFSETFYNSILSRPMTYAEFYLESIGDYNRSLLIMTDAHASLYEDMDHFLGDMSTKVRKIKSTAFADLRNGRNLCVVANNLVRTKRANLILGAALCSTEYGSYPAGNYGEAIFDIDDSDLEGIEVAYFRNNFLKPSSIENLRNFRTEKDAAKLVPINMVINYIERELDFSEYRGRGFSEYVRMQIQKRLGEFFSGITGKIIRGYRIDAVDFVRTSPGAGMIVNSFTIMPINSNEEFSLAMEV